MNILKRFARQAKKATATDAELFYDLEKETVAYLDTNGNSVGLLNKMDDAPSDKCVLLIRTDGTKVNKITAQNTLNTSDYSFDLSVEPAPNEQITFVLENQRSKVFSDMNITRISFDHFFEGTATEYHVRWKIADNQLIFVVFSSEGTPLSFGEEIISIWLEIEVFKNVESEVFRVINRKEKPKEDNSFHLVKDGIYTMTKSSDELFRAGFMLEADKNDQIFGTITAEEGTYTLYRDETKEGGFILRLDSTEIGKNTFDENNILTIKGETDTFTITYAPSKK